eukprot:m.35539 g.35539  ORF g.35539 m.35539 type:complete len:75 (+) comp8889_c0_seq2:1377-1601(+)
MTISILLHSPTDAAGGFADGFLLERCSNIGLDARAFLENNDSYNLLSATKDIFKTGLTATNVMDIQIVLIHPNR